MDMAQNGSEASGLRRIWKGWRKEIIRGAVLFTAVIGIGLVATRMFGLIPLRFGGRGFNFEDFDLDHREWIESFRWAGVVPDQHTVWIRNLNGPVSIEAAEGDSVVVTADKSWHRSDPHVVDIMAIPQDGSVTVCAVWEGEQASCEARGHYAMNKVRHNDVAVRFTVQVPAGVQVDVSTVNGRLEADGVRGPLKLMTINGSIDATTAMGGIDATTVNGGIDATIEDLGPDGDVTLKTVNGSISLALPAGLNADLDAQTVAGRVNTDFPVQVAGRISSRHVQAKIGTGGRRVELRTVNGSIDLQESGAAVPEPPEPVVAPRPARAARAPRAASAPRQPR